MYFYRLGHIPELALSEFATIFGESSVSAYDQSFLKSEQKVNVNEFGSLVFRAKIIERIERANLEDLNKNELSQKIADYIKKTEIKKWGLNIHKKYQKDLLKNVKNAGAKKVNVTFKNELNFGDVKQSKNWIQLIYFKDEIFLTHLSNFSNQEFWSKIDYSLPHNDLRRGIINLKLARSLFNLAGGEKTWWDPFMGQGRMLVGNMDKTEVFLGSDLEEKVLHEARENIEFGQNYFQWNVKFLEETSREGVSKDLEVESENSGVENGEKEEIKNHQENSLKGEKTKKEYRDFRKLEFKLFIQDAKEKVSLNTLENDGVDLKNVKTVITEGYLGRTLFSHPNEIRAKDEIKLVANIWKVALKNFEELGIQTIVACLPFYPQVSGLGEKYFTQVLKEIIKESRTSFRIESFFEDETFIPYSRKESFTGHLIFRLVRE